MFVSTDISWINKSVILNEVFLIVENDPHTHTSKFSVCVSAFTKTMTVNGQEYNLQLVDTAGQVSSSTGNFIQLSAEKLQLISPQNLHNNFKLNIFC